MVERYLPVDWPAPARVRALVTTRNGGYSTGDYHSFNLASRCGDDEAAVAANRRLLATDNQWSAAPCWIHQVHGIDVVKASAGLAGEPEADAIYTWEADVPCLVLTADCLPVLFCHRHGDIVAAAHAGWRGLAAGVLEQTLAAMNCAGEDLLVWLGPAISQAHFEVGPEVREAFLAPDPGAACAFLPSRGERWMADLYTLARRRLQQAGVTRIHGGNYCTFRQDDLFFSYRRDGKASGRLATAIWIDDNAV